MKNKIIEYIKRNRVSTTEIADCLGKSGALDGIFPLNRGKYSVGEIFYTYASHNSNWNIHEDLANNKPSNKIIFIDGIDVNNRAIIGELVSKYILLYLGNNAIICNGKMRDATGLIKEMYPIWLSGVSPVGCFNNKVSNEDVKSVIEVNSNFYNGAIAVCDDSGVVVIPKENHTGEFLNKIEQIEIQEDIWFDRLDRYKESTFDIVCKKKYLEL